MPRKLFFILPLLFALLAAPVQAEEKTLYVYTWDTYADEELFRRFEQETGIKAVADIYSSNEAMMAKLQAGAAYDVISPSGSQVPVLLAEKLLAPLPEDIRALGDGLTDNLKNPVYDPQHAHALPMFFGTTGLAVNTKLLKEEITSWGQFFSRPAGEKPSLGVLDDISTVMNTAAIFLGRPFCDDNPETFKAYQELLAKQKPAVKVYGATGYFERLAAGEIALQMAWSGDVYKARQENPDLRYVYPKEGVEFWSDTLAVPATAKNQNHAHAFIRFVMKPENLAQYAAFAGNVPSMTAAFPHLPEELRKAPEFSLPEGLKGETSVACPPAVIKAHDKIWTRLQK